MSDLNPAAPQAATASIADQEGVSVLRLSGELDLATVADIQRSVDAISGQAPEHLVVDLSGVTFMDSSGIALLLQIAATRPRTELRNPTPLIRRVLEMTGLTETLPIVP
jgi:anti-sigma B factor antagonist